MFFAEKIFFIKAPEKDSVLQKNSGIFIHKVGFIAPSIRSSAAIRFPVFILEQKTGGCRFMVYLL